MSADKCEVRRVGATVGLMLEVSPDDLVGVDLTKPLLVLACFETAADANKIRRAWGKALDDAAAARARVGADDE